jgi:hypothetical protein
MNGSLFKLSHTCLFCKFHVSLLDCFETFEQIKHTEFRSKTIYFLISLSVLFFEKVDCFWDLEQIKHTDFISTFLLNFQLNFVSKIVELSRSNTLTLYQLFVAIWSKFSFSDLNLSQNRRLFHIGLRLTYINFLLNFRSFSVSKSCDLSRSNTLILYHLFCYNLYDFVIAAQFSFLCFNFPSIFCFLPFSSFFS